MTGGFHIGRSQSAGYGRIQVDQIKPLTTWQEYAPMAIDAQTVVLTLLSDTLLRDSQGRWSTNINTFLQPLGLPAPTATYLAGEIASGFNRKWGLPLPQTPALAAGSVFIFHKLADTERAALLEKLRPFILSGIGERRCEGFGRIGVNVHGLSQLSYRLPSRTRSNGENGAPELTGASATLAQQMVTRLYREMLDRKLLDAIEHPTMKIEPSLENNQLSQLRVVVRQSLSEANPPIVTNFLKNLRSPARKQYHKAKIVGMSLFEWLMAGWQEQQIWRTHFNIDKAQRPHIGNVTATPTAELRYEYTVRLVDALCRKMVRLNQQQAQKQEEQKGVQS
jgi:CRISPR-associated protein Csx10